MQPRPVLLLGAVSAIRAAEGGTTSLTTRLMQRYLDRVTRLLPTMEQAERAFLASAHFVAPPRVLFAPAIVARALTLSPDPNTYTAPKKPLAH